MIEADTKKSLAALLGDRVEFDTALSRHTSLRIGGPADALVTPKDRNELAQVLAICHARALSTMVLGAGFNVLIREGGIRGVVLRLKKLRAIERVAENAISIEAAPGDSATPPSETPPPCGKTWPMATSPPRRPSGTTA